MNLNLSDQDLAFRDEVRRFLDDNLTAELRQTGARLTSVYAGRQVAAAWQARDGRLASGVERHGSQSQSQARSIPN